MNRDGCWVVASGNRGKLKEIGWALRHLSVELVPAGELVPGFDPEETGATFEANAAIKALAAFEATGRPSIADDSGLCVVGLNGEPGVFSARYAGEGRSDAERVTFLLERMKELEGEARKAWFQCCCVAIVPAHRIASDPSPVAEPAPLPAGWGWIVANGYIHGRIGFEPRGCHGFGYDPVFLPDLFPGRTLAELSLEEKTRVSHRGLAFTQFASRVLP